MAVNSLLAVRKLWQTLSAVKTGVVLLITVVIVAATGTIILQRPNTDPDEMQRAYSLQVLRVLDATGLTDVYHSWWFILLLVLVSLAIVAASIQRLPNSLRYFSHPYKSPDESFRKALPLQERIPIEDEEAAVLVTGRALRKLHVKSDLIVSHGHIGLFGECNRLSELAVYVVHASLLFIFLGGIVDGLWGWSGFVALTRGEQSNQVKLRDGGTRALPFAIRCEGAGQENYADGTPKRWWSKLAVIEHGSDVKRKEIVVNDPLVYRGVRFYQSSYGPNGKLDRLVLTATSAAVQNGDKTVSLSEGETRELDPDTSVQLAEFIPDYVVGDGQVYTRSKSVENPAVHLVVRSKKSGKNVNVWLPPIEGFAENDKSTYRFEAQDLSMGYYTGLQVSHQPGQWFVWAGVILMSLGLAFVFYLVHMRFWAVPVRDANGRLLLWVGGTANKNREAFEQRFRALVKEIRSTLKLESEGCTREHASSLAGD